MKTGALVAVNAGSTASYSLPIPVGLLVTRGKIISAANFKATNAGVLCIGSTLVSIESLSAFRPANCSYAVQRGPLLSPGSAMLAKSAGDRYRRTVIAVDKKGSILILVTRSKATLSGISAFLYKTQPDLNVKSALNMDGDVSSGLILVGGSAIQPIEVGNVDALVASAIAIYSRSQR